MFGYNMTKADARLTPPGQSWGQSPIWYHDENFVTRVDQGPGEYTVTHGACIEDQILDRYPYSFTPKTYHHRPVSTDLAVVSCGVWWKRCQRKHPKELPNKWSRDLVVERNGHNFRISHFSRRRDRSPWCSYCHLFSAFECPGKKASQISRRRCFSSLLSYLWFVWGGP